MKLYVVHRKWSSLYDFDLILGFVQEDTKTNIFPLLFVYVDLHHGFLAAPSVSEEYFLVAQGHVDYVFLLKAKFDGFVVLRGICKTETFPIVCEQE